MAWKCIVEGKELADERADRRTSESVEKYKVSQNAVYFEGQYLPASQIRSLRVQPSVYRPQTCCGRGVPVLKIKVEYGAEKPLILMVEREKNADRIVKALTAANPAIEIETYVDPVTGEKPERLQSGIM